MTRRTAIARSPSRAAIAPVRAAIPLATRVGGLRRHPGRRRVLEVVEIALGQCDLLGPARLSARDAHRLGGEGVRAIDVRQRFPESGERGDAHEALAERRAAAEALRVP